MEKPTVLVVEDSPYLAESLIDMLTMQDLRAIHSATGREGVTTALSEQPDLILLDIRLPDISGYEVYQQIRQDPWGKDAKIMVLTASESIENIARNIDLPSEYVMFKPDWSIKELMEKITKHLSD